MRLVRRCFGTKAINHLFFSTAIEKSSHKTIDSAKLWHSDDGIKVGLYSKFGLQSIASSNISKWADLVSRWPWR